MLMCNDPLETFGITCSHHLEIDRYDFLGIITQCCQLYILLLLLLSRTYAAIKLLPCLCCACSVVGKKGEIADLARLQNFNGHKIQIKICL